MDEPGDAAGGPPAPAEGALAAGELERVIRRASDLQFRGGEPGAGTALDEAELLRIGREVGLEPRYVRQALAEVRADALVPAAPPDLPLAARALGPGWARSGRVVPGTREEVERELARHFRDRELLKRVRSRPGRSMWEPAGGLLSTMRRAMDVGGHGYHLARSRAVQAAVEPLEPERCLVTLTADLRNERTQAAAGFFSGFGLAGVAAAIVLVAQGGPELPLLLGAGGAGGLAAGSALLATRAYYRRRRERVEVALAGLLDRLERGEPLGGAPAGWKDRLLR